MNRIRLLLAIASVGALAVVPKAVASQSVTLTQGKPMVLENGTSVALKKELQLTSAIRVQTNGTFIVNQGQPRKLEEGQVLDDEGMLTSPNGTSVPVLDHVTLNRGRVTVIRDGQSSVLDRELILKDGTRVRPDGTLLTPANRLQRLQDGQILQLSGQILAAKDTVTLRGGKVFVQKEGTQFTLQPQQTLMMNEGTKVYGDGKLVRADGSTQQLKEGEIVKLEGILPPRR